MTKNSKKYDECVTKIKRLIDDKNTMVVEDFDSQIELNIETLVQLIDIAGEEIRIYTDKIKDETYGDNRVIQQLKGFIIRYPHCRLKILLKQFQNNLEETKLYKMLSELKPEYKKQIEIRYMKKLVDSDFNCLVVDQFAYKLKIIEQQASKAYISFNDTQGVAVAISVVFNQHFNWYKSTKVDGFGTSYNLSNIINRKFNNNDIESLATKGRLLALRGYVVPDSFQDFKFNIQVESK
ncbi:hypothetical protein SPONL_984 [uncultured Candidatus Thioglobus sp.]|nr:hypothetical protein SPONL_984 [uncultured Candidatus Thioglobus sp.]